MGYYIFSYGIKTEEIQNVFGSKDNTILNLVQSNKTFQLYDPQCTRSPISLSGAVDEIIKGHPICDKRDDIYGYALVCFCATLGKELPYNQDIKLGYGTDMIDEILSEDFDIKDFDTERTLFRNSHTFPIIKTLDPGTGVIQHAELMTIRNKLSSVHITNEKIDELAGAPNDREFGYEYLQGLIININYCVDQGLDMISFCH